MLRRNQLDRDALPERQMHRRPNRAHRPPPNLPLQAILAAQDLSLADRAGQTSFHGDGLIHRGDNETAVVHTTRPKVLPPRLRPPSPPWLRPAGANPAHPRETPEKSGR